MGGVGCQWGVVLAQWGAGRVLQGTWHIVQGTGVHGIEYRVQYMVVLAQWGAQERQNWPGAQECETPSYPSSCFKTESEKFNSVLDSILMFVLIL